MTANVIGMDVWWDHDKHIFRKKRINLEKIPLIFRCPLCGGVVAPPRERHIKHREVTDWVEVQRHNSKALKKYFERDNPPQEEFKEWHEKIRTEHEDEFKKNVYIEYFAEPLTLVLNRTFYGVYACKGCVRNHPRRYFVEGTCYAKAEPRRLEVRTSCQRTIKDE